MPSTAPRHRIAPTTARRAAAITLLTLSTLAAGCVGGLDAIDAQTRRLLRQTSEGLGPSTRVPPREHPPAGDYERPDQADTSVLTDNPATDELEWLTAPEDRDVATRLTTYAEEAAGVGGEVRVISLEEAFRLSQISAREFLTAEESYILSAISVLIQRHLFSPRLFNDTSFFIDGDGENGRFDNVLSVVNDLRVTQRLPYGGDVEARWIWQATQNLRSSVSERYRQSSSIALDASIPLMRGAGNVARESLIQAERNLIYAARTFERFRRSLLVSIANDYFRLLERKAVIRNQIRQVESLETLEEATAARVEAGRLSEFQRNIVANQVLAGKSTLASLRESYILDLDRFKLRLGLDPTLPIDVTELTFSVPEPETNLVEATDQALSFRLDLQNARDQLSDARRDVTNARNDLLPDFDITGGVSVPTDPNDTQGGVLFDFDDTSYRAGVNIGLPLDRQIERLNVRQATIRLERALREFDRFRDDVVIDARSAVRSVDLARFSLNLAERQVEINRRRLEEQQLKEDTVDQQTLVDSENALLSAQNNRDAARTDLRNAVLDYLLTTGQLRVGPDGEFDALPGMTPGG
ncbi:MAG: TolC family protein [Planctomycetota bacterium]